MVKYLFYQIVSLDCKIRFAEHNKSGRLEEFSK